MKSSSPVMTVENFSRNARFARRYFDERFENPLDPSANRFIWDYWHVPNQYRLLRTPAHAFFPPAILNLILEDLSCYGREVLGCVGLTAPWLSCYIDDCQQGLHADVPHGPWAYVWSLTPNKNSFRGGETIILKPATLNYWQHFDTYKGVELPQLATKVAPKFNRLTVFDPRLPHGVTPVSGAHDLLEGRLVLHGWFTEPQPFVMGPLSRVKATKVLNQGLEQLDPVFESHPDVHGTMSLRLKVKASGQVTTSHSLTDTLQLLHSTNEAHTARRLQLLRKDIHALFRKLVFPKATGPSNVTVPILFRF